MKSRKSLTRRFHLILEKRKLVRIFSKYKMIRIALMTNDYVTNWEVIQITQNGNGNEDAKCSVIVTCTNPHWANIESAIAPDEKCTAWL